MTKIDLQTETIDVPYPDAESIALEIMMGASGDVRVAGGTADRFVAGTVEYNIAEWKPEVQQRGSTVRIVQWPRIEDAGWEFLNIENRWNLRLGSAKPFSLDVGIGANRGRWDLGGLPLTDLRVQTGASHNTFSFDAPNPVTMQTLEVGAGAAAVELDGLLNANFRRMDVKGGAGQVTLRFTGAELKQDARIKIEGGAGHFAITVGETIPARVKTTGLMAVVAQGAFSRQSGLPFFSGAYTTPAYDTATGPRLEFEITVGVGAITLDTR